MMCACGAYKYQSCGTYMYQHPYTQWRIQKHIQQKSVALTTYESNWMCTDPKQQRKRVLRVSCKCVPNARFGMRLPTEGLYFWGDTRAPQNRAKILTTWKHEHNSRQNTPSTNWRYHLRTTSRTKQSSHKLFLNQRQQTSEGLLGPTNNCTYLPLEKAMTANRRIDDVFYMVYVCGAYKLPNITLLDSVLFAFGSVKTPIYLRGCIVVAGQRRAWPFDSTRNPTKRHCVHSIYINLNVSRVVTFQVLAFDCDFPPRDVLCFWGDTFQWRQSPTRTPHNRANTMNWLNKNMIYETNLQQIEDITYK